MLPMHKGMWKTGAGEASEVMQTSAGHGADTSTTKPDLYTALLQSGDATHTVYVGPSDLTGFQE